MFYRLIHTTESWTQLFLRLVLAVVIFPHGAQKALGWFGGGGIAGTIHFMNGKFGIPVVLAVLAIAAESLGSLALFVGLLGRVAAFGIAMNMTVSLLLVHIHNGFLMNWSGRKPGEGSEFHILMLAIALTIIVNGSGAWSLDRRLTEALARPRGRPIEAHA